MKTVSRREASFHCALQAKDEHPQMEHDVRFNQTRGEKSNVFPDFQKPD
jgi:hypothetical protein